MSDTHLLPSSRNKNIRHMAQFQLDKRKALGLIETNNNLKTKFVVIGAVPSW